MTNPCIIVSSHINNDEDSDKILQIKNNELLFLQARTNLAQAKEMGEKQVRDRSQAGVGELCHLELSDFGEDDELPDSVSALTTLGEEGDEGEAEPAVKKSFRVSSWWRGFHRGELWLELLGEPPLDKIGERRPEEVWEDT